ncbi:Zn(2)-C6 fungal-type DNA-binding domain protein [Moelleriella libera RCEF 2490]|uniref:Zn(2)-C6 fungal-type DNA-binding domain protein n=1 Tax=Moelleriella libera RCEF 2490 TaxID=1081109 RepID=A0A167VFS7_9HYPO|nr:Zn(2)-C6 fungal-type DNA-binding domain protein [Moelleriella libera RCEF 2490]
MPKTLSAAAPCRLRSARASTTDADKKQRGKPRGMRRDRDCRSCRLRDVKCDLNRPSCAQCVEANIPCGGYPQRVIWASERMSADAGLAGTTSTNPSTAVVPGQKRQRKISHPGTPDVSCAVASAETPVGSCASAAEGERAAEPEDVNSTMRESSVADQNSFITTLVVFCQHIISSHGAGAENHSRYLSKEAVRLISQLNDLMQTRIERRVGGASASREMWDSLETTRHSLAVLGGLNEVLEAANPFALLGIAAFAVLEVCDSPFGEWQRHLYGAKSLLDYHCPDQKSLEHLSEALNGLTEIVSRLVWFDTLGAIARGTEGLIFDDWHRQTVDPRLFQTVGCPPDTFELFNRVAGGQIAADTLESCILATEQLAKIDRDESAWGLSANVNRCASAIAVLAQLQEANASAKEALSSAVDQACRLIAMIPPSSIYYIHIAVPAYLAGMNATCSTQCDILRAYWRRCTHAGVQRYPDGLTKCEDQWRLKGLNTDLL